MSDTVYRVLLALETSGNLTAKIGDMGGAAREADRSIGSLGEGAKRMGETIAGMGERVGGFLEGIADKAIDVAEHIAKIGIAATVGVAAYGVMGLNNELEQTKISLGAIAQAQGFTKTFEQGFALAGDELDKMKKDVKTLPGDLGQLSNLMKMIATPAAQGGANMDQIRVLAGRTMLTSQILGVNQEMAAREMANLLAGRAGAHNILGTRLGLVGDAAKTFNAESASARLATINKDLDKYQGAADRFGQSFIANWTTLKDNVKYGLIAEATGPLFDEVKHTLAEINTYFDEHKDKIKDITSTVGDRLVRGWQSVESAVKRVDAVAGPFLDKLLHMQPAEIGHRIEEAGKIVLGTKLAGAAISGGAGLIPGLMKMGTAAGGEGVLSGLATAAPAVGVAFVAAAAAAIPLAGIFDNLTDSTRRYHDQDVELAESLGKKTTQMVTAMGPAEEIFRRLSDTIGHGALFALDVMASQVLQFGSAISYASQALGDLIYVIRAGGLFNGGFDSLVNKKVFDASIDKVGPIKDHEIGDLMNHHGEAFANGLLAKTNAADAAKVKGGAGTHIQKVEIIVKGTDDPSRVARLTLQQLLSLGSRTSSHVGNYESPTRSR